MTTIKADRNPPAYPDWDDLTPADQADHREWCHDLCAICDGHRAFGTCSTCGDDTEAIGPDELSRCCGSRTLLDSPSEDNLAALRAA